MSEGEDVPERTKVFVITPIGGEESATRTRADDLLELVINPCLADVNRGREGPKLYAVRSDKVDRPGSITVQIVRDIVESRFVIVDATGLNPNVFYELGIADAFTIPTIRVVDDPSTLPFDTHDHRAIALPHTSDGFLTGRAIQAARVSMLSQIRDILAADFEVSSVVTAAGTRARISAVTADLAESGDETSRGMATIASQLSDLTEMVGDIFVSTGGGRSPAPASGWLDPKTYRYGIGERLFALGRQDDLDIQQVETQTGRVEAALTELAGTQAFTSKQLERIAVDLGVAVEVVEMLASAVHGNESALARDRADWVAFALIRPVINPPGPNWFSPWRDEEPF